MRAFGRLIFCPAVNTDHHVDNSLKISSEILFFSLPRSASILFPGIAVHRSPSSHRCPPCIMGRIQQFWHWIKEYSHTGALNSTGQMVVNSQCLAVTVVTCSVVATECVPHAITNCFRSFQMIQARRRSTLTNSSEEAVRCSVGVTNVRSLIFPRCLV